MIRIGKNWKSFWIVLGIIVFIGAIVVGIGVFVVAQVMQQMRGVAEEVYGGPLPEPVMSLVAYQAKRETTAVYFDPAYDIAIILIQKPKIKPTRTALTTTELKAEIEQVAIQPEFETLLTGSAQGQESSLQIGSQKTSTLQYINFQGGASTCGIIPLKNNDLVFIAMGDTPLNTSRAVSLFLMKMPRIVNDAQFHPAAPSTSQHVSSLATLPLVFHRCCL